MSERTKYDDRVPVAASASGGVEFRAALVAVATVLGAVAFTAFMVWHAPYERDEVVPYDTMLDIREGWWSSHYLGGTAMGLGFVALALATCLLVRRGAGSALVTVGAGLCVFGGVGTAAGLASEGTAYYYATERDALAAEPAAGLLKYLFEEGDRIFALGIAGLVAASIGSLLISAGLWRARAAHRWVSVALALGTVMMMVTPHAVTWWTSLPRSAAAVAIGVYVWLSSRAGSGAAGRR
jgi:hypothetical protein